MRAVISLANGSMTKPISDEALVELNVLYEELIQQRTHRTQGMPTLKDIDWGFRIFEHWPAIRARLK